MGILETICGERRADALRMKRERPPSSLAREAGPPRLAFARAGEGAVKSAASGGGLLIAECKRASPSRGLMVKDYDPLSLALAYERGGALMISVLTEPRRFLGSDEDLSAVRAAVGLPVLRKDFLVDPYQVLEAWAIGADAILLIAAALEESELLELAAAARELSLGILVEVHDEAEIGKALSIRPEAIGVNSRDLRDFSVDSGRAAALFRLLPVGPARVAESGMKKPEDAAALKAAGFDAFLIGEALATSPDPESMTRAFVAAIKGEI
jgi:indole-3-glycerol phosphate synthase